MQKHPLLSGLHTLFGEDGGGITIVPEWPLPLGRSNRCSALESLHSCPEGAPGACRPPALSLEYIQPQFLPSGFVPGAPPCCCSTPAAMELGQNLWVGRCCDLIFLALGAGSGLLASSMGCRMRLRALMNLPRGGGDSVNHYPGGGGTERTCVRVRARGRAKRLPDSQQLIHSLRRTADWDLTRVVKAQLSEGPWSHGVTW